MTRATFAPAGWRRDWPTVRGCLLGGALLAAVVLLIAYKALKLSGYPLWVPLKYYEGDVVVMLMYIKGLVQDGWPSAITHLSAPFGYSGAAFPMQASFDWLLIKGLALFTREPGLLLNAFWLSTLVMGAWSMAFAAWQMRVSALLAGVCGVLYAFLPFALLRFPHHLNLVYHLVPLLCLLAVRIAAGPAALRNPAAARNVGLVACVLQGFDYAYFSFFAAALFGIAGLIALRRDGWRALRLPLLAGLLVTAATALNLMPSLQSWERQGKPPEMGYKAVAEAEVYGGKLRTMLLPHRDNPVAPLARLAARSANANFPLENENETARLGLFGAFGMVLMLCLRLRVNARSREDASTLALDAASALGLASFLFITVGGLGAVFNLLTVPDIRGYNRFSVFLSFFATVAAALWLEARLAPARRWRLAGYAAIGAFACFSLADQLLDARRFFEHRDADIASAQAERAIVARLEQVLPPGSAVLQLPFGGYPPIAVHENMISYDHARYFLWSKHLRWSWPSFSQQHAAWQERLDALRGQAFVDGAILSGMDAIWIDTAAYKDKGAVLIAGLQLDPATRIDTGGGRIAAFDLRAAAARLRARLGEQEFARQKRDWLQNSVAADWQAGFYPQEVADQGATFRWSDRTSVLQLRNHGDSAIDVCAGFDVAMPNGGTLRIAGGATPVTVRAEAAPRPVRVPLRLQPGERRKLQLVADTARIAAPGDPRQLYFRIMSFHTGLLASAAGACSNQ
jgi:phosphoglycerol transferase